MAFINKKSENNKKLYIFFAACALISFLLMSGVFGFLAKEKSFAMPNMVLCVAVISAAYLGDKASGVFSLVCGFLCDLFITDPLSFSPMLFLIGVFLAKLVLHYFSQPGTIAIAVSVLPCLILHLVIDTIVFVVSFDGASLWGVLTEYTLLQLAVDFAAAIVISFCIKRIQRLFR